MLDMIMNRLNMHRGNDLYGVDSNGDTFALHTGTLSIKKVIEMVNLYNPTTLRADFTVYTGGGDRDIKKQVNTYFNRLKRIGAETGLEFPKPDNLVIDGYVQVANFVSIGIITEVK